MSGDPLNDPTVGLAVVRRFTAAQAPGVAKLVAQVYGDTYHPKDLYDPGQIAKFNETGRLVSVVALDVQGEVVGHYALECPRQGKVAEASDAMVRPDFRHHHILDDMRVVLREEAVKHGLTGVVGYAVTNHVFTQKAEEHSGAAVCGIALGLWPKSFHNMPEPLTQRMSFAIYFKYLRQPSEMDHIATQHEAMIARIYQQFGVKVNTRQDTGPSGQGVISVEVDDDVGTATVHVEKIGTDTAAAVAKACEDLFGMTDVRALTIEIPLTQPGVGEVCNAAQAKGFFFCGLGPAFSSGEDALILQMPREEIDASLVQIDQPLAKEMLAYIQQESARLGKKRD